MGLFDKMKNLVGAHGVTVAVTELEGEPTNSAVFPLHDSILKGRIQVMGEKKVIILNHAFRLTAIYETGDDYRETLLAEDINEGEILGAEYSWPYKLKPGQTVDDSFSLGPFDIPDAMRKLELDPDDAITNGNVRIELKVVADVKSTPVDASTKRTLTIVPGGSPGNVEDYADDSDDHDLPDIPARTSALPLDNRPYLQRFHELIAELEAHTRIEVTEQEIHAPAPPSLLDDIAASHPVPPALRRFYEQANGLTIRWQVIGGDGDQCGNINLLPIERVYGSWKDVLWFDEDWDDGSNKPLHPVDYFIEEACCALYLDGSDNPTVYYHDDEPQSLRVDFAGYLELLLKSRGFWYWPLAVVADLTGDEYTTEPGNFRRSMPQLFDDYDPRFFLRRSYADQDVAEDAERAQQIAEVRAALDAQGATYHLSEAGMGYIDIAVADRPDNLAKISAALESIGMSTDFSGDWSARAIGSYMFERSPDL